MFRDILVDFLVGLYTLKIQMIFNIQR